MRSEAQKRADQRLAEKRVSVTFMINRDSFPEVAKLLENAKKEQGFKESFMQWLIDRNN